MNPLQMKAVIASGYGAPGVLQVHTIAKPVQQPNEVLVKIRATPVTAADSMMRKGTPRYVRLFLGWNRPKSLVPGTGFSGVIEAVGEQVTKFKPGDKVFGETGTNFKSNAEYLSIAEDGIILKMPSHLDFEEAATISDGPLTSFNFLKNLGQIKAGQKVLINGASGSLGTAAVQLAKYFGAEVTGVCSGRNVDLVKSLGADRVIDYSKSDFTKPENPMQQYDLIYDTVGKSSFKKCKPVLSRTGIYLSPVLSLPLLFQMLWTSIFKTKKAKFTATGLAPIPQLRQMLARLKEIILAGQLKVIIDKRYTLDEITEAHAYVDSGHKRGNVVITI